MIHRTENYPASLFHSFFVGGALASGLILGSASASSVQLGAAKDTTIFQNGVSNSAGGQVQFFSGTNNATPPSPRRALIEFDVSKIPAAATITSVELTLYLSMVAGGGMGGGGGSPTIGLHELTREWGEGTVSSGGGQGDAAKAGDATWSSAQFGSELWTTPGGDFDSTASASLSIVGTKTGVPYTWTSTKALVDDVQGWLGDESTNHGWLLLNADEISGTTFRAFSSHEAAESLRPVLTINYVPEPSTLGLLAAGSALALSMRRRPRRSKESVG